MTIQQEEITTPTDPETSATQEIRCYKIQFREAEQVHSATSKIINLAVNDVILAQTDHGLEPAMVLEAGATYAESSGTCPKASFTIVRRASRDEIDKYNRLIEREIEGFGLCKRYIETHTLAMKLIKVERFFNGSKIIFYFTAENRIDFRELVKDLVQEFRTRVEIRQVGVRHETKLIGGLGCCGRELCCSSFITNFAPVSIKMAKEQDLPLNPAKISGICNRLLCCLTYEYNAYKTAKKNMPKPGKIISVDGKQYKVIHNNALRETITVISQEDPGKHVLLDRDQWGEKPPQEQNRPGKKHGKKSGSSGDTNEDD
ncbi:MAG: hypothetical protein KKA70_05270 [Proteobacteria bacterium]|nr:hypothetical protein [Pseudomonadota bacterium]